MTSKLHYICPRCGNSNPTYIGHDKKGNPYCRKCILFYGTKAPEHKFEGNLVTLNIPYSLSKEQKAISKQLVTNYKNGIDSLVNAVCGSGKTEIVFNSIKHALVHKQTVGFAIPRRDVVIELYLRLKTVFNSNSVIAVYGGSTSKLDADIVVLTTHQLYRYEKYFDLLILDEIDAFPFNGNDLLYAMFERAIKGHSILMSATPSEKILKTYKKSNKMILELNTRYHKHPLPVPLLIEKNSLQKLSCLKTHLGKYLSKKKPVLIFVPTIAICEELYNKIKQSFNNGYYVHSKLSNRPEIIKHFKQGNYQFLITTAVLERGVTIRDLQVIVFGADNELYDEHTLVQIAGRVGRKADAPEGEVIFIGETITNAMEKARDTIISKNKSL